MNLILTGRAASNVFDGVMNLDSGDSQKVKINDYSGHLLMWTGVWPQNAGINPAFCSP